MTCICAIVEKGNVYMAGDSAGVAGLSVTVRDDEKVFNVGPFIMGFTSSFRMGDILRFKFNPPEQTVKQTDREYMVTSFIDELRRCFIDNGYGDKEGTRGGCFLVGYKGNLYTVGSDHQIGISTAKYDSVGCGSDIALGSLYSTRGMEPRKRISMALSAAVEFNGGVRPPFNHVKLEAIIKKVKSKPVVKKRAK